MAKFKWHIPKIPIYDSKLANTFFLKKRIEVFNKILPVIQMGIVTKTPVGATTRLKNSILTKQSGNKGSVFTDLSYAVTVNDGRKMAPVARSADDSLKAWIRLSKKGKAFFSALQSKYRNMTIERAVFLLKKGKAEKPTPGQFFFEKGSASVTPILGNTYSRLLKSFADGLVT